MINHINNCSIPYCSCKTYGTCCFSHYFRVCLTNTPKHRSYWWRGQYSSFGDLFVMHLFPISRSSNAYLHLSYDYVQWESHGVPKVNVLFLYHVICLVPRTSVTLPHTLLSYIFFCPKLLYVSMLYFKGTCLWIEIAD